MREQWAQSTQGSCTHISGMGSRAWEMPEASTWIIVTCLQMSVAMFGHSFVIVNIGKCPRAKQGEEKVHQSFWRLWQEKAVRCMNLSRRERVYHTEVVTSSVCIHPLPQVRPSAHNEWQITREWLTANVGQVQAENTQHLMLSQLTLTSCLNSYFW